LLQSVVKSLTDIVMPAVDPNNKLAQEQVRLILGLVQITMNRLPLMYRYDRHEITRFNELADRLIGQSYRSEPARQAAERLGAVKAQSLDVLERARAEPAELEDTVMALSTAISDLMRAVHAEGDRSQSRQVRGHIFAAGKEQLDRERAWSLPFGFEADPGMVKPIETLLDPVPKRR
jgi:hypothetical protein